MKRLSVLVLISATFCISLWGSQVQAEDESAFVSLRNQLFQLERALAVLSQTSEMAPAVRTAKADKIQSEIKSLKKRLDGHFAPADIALGDAVDAVQKHGSGWFLSYLSHGKYTGRKSEHHKPLEAVDIPGKNPNLAGRASLPILGYPLMVILSYDPICREAYREFIPQMEAVARDMEKKAGKPLEFFDRQPTVIANDLGWDVDRFWGFAQSCSEKVVNKYFWNSSPGEVLQARNVVSLIICAAFLNNVTIDVNGDKETQSKKAFWRANAAPWFIPDKSNIRNKFHVFHIFTHAWLTYLKLFNDARYDDQILDYREARVPTQGILKNAFLFSNVVGASYEAISTFAGTKHGFLETTAVNELPKSLKKVAQVLHLKNIVGFEALTDIKDNREGAWFGAALYLRNGSLKLSQIPEHRQIVEDWQKDLKNRGEMVVPEEGGPAMGQTEIFKNGQITLFDLNPPEGKKRISSGFFREVYRGMGAFEPSAHAAAEIQAFKHLLGEDVMSYNLRQLFSANFSNIPQTAEAWKAAKAQHAQIIFKHFEEADSQKRSGMFRDLYSNEGKRLVGDDYNQEADYVYATKRWDIAGCYGPIVLAIREKTPRGLDLNKIAKDYKYYSAARFFRSAIQTRWKTMLGDYILDDEEYLLPSYVSSAEIVGFVARSPNTKVVKTHVDAADKDFCIAFKAPPILRAYEKKMMKGYLVIDVFDGKKGLIQRFSESPDNTEVDETVQKSSEKIPETISAAWNEYLHRVRR
ncbi:MAG: hypothetical protein WA705_12695 [Candidatus Ozemobacteraceae bacterium]